MPIYAAPVAAGQVVWGFLLVASTVAGAGLDNFAGTNLLAGAVFLETGNGSTLVRTNLPWIAPTNLSHPALVFTFGFASDDVFAPEEFFDSFTITLRNADRSFVAPLITADLLGVTLAPADPEGAQFEQTNVQPEPLVFPSLPTAFRFQQAFLVLVVMPPSLVGGNGTLGISLFDNLNTQRSVAFINHLAVIPGPGTFMMVESSASVAGPYAKEDEVFVRHARRCLTFPRSGAHRFYRLRGTSESHIALMRADGSNWLFHYTGAGGNVPPALESSAQVAGPYAVEGGVLANNLSPLLRVPKDGAARFFRVHCEVPLTLRRLTMEADQMLITYEEPRP